MKLNQLEIDFQFIKLMKLEIQAMLWRNKKISKKKEKI